MKKTKKNIDMTTEGINDMWEEVEHPHRKDESSNQKNKTRKTYQDVNRRKSRPRYAPGIQYDNYGDRSYQSRKIVSKPKRNWGTRIALFLLLMIAMYFVKKTGIGDLSQSNNTLNPNAPTTPDSSVAGVRFNYHLDYIDFTAAEAPETEVAIRDFLNIYKIDYSDMKYDYENMVYRVKLDDSIKYNSEDEVVAAGQEIQNSYQTYCYGKGSNYGVSQTLVQYGYQEWK